MREHLKAFYLEYVNAFITVQAMSDYKNMTEEDTKACIDMGRALHEEDCARGRIRYSEVGDQRTHHDGSISTLVDNGDGTKGVLTRACPTVPPAYLHSDGVIRSTPEPALYGYVCFYNGKRHELRASSKMAAVTAAVAYFKPPKSKAHMVSVVLAERPDGTEVVHSTASL